MFGTIGNEKKERTDMGQMIATTRNKLVKELLQLKKKAKYRREQKCFVSEGRKMYMETPPEQIEQIVVSRTFSKQPENQGLLVNRDYVVAEDFVFEACSETKTPQGILCVVRQPEYSFSELLKQKNPMFLVLEDLQDPGNLGTIMRTAEGAGATALLLGKGCVDLYNPKTVRSTMGSIYRVPFLYFEDLKEVLMELKKNDILVCAAHLKGKKYYDRVNYKEGGVAFLVGNESRGISEELVEQAELLIKIPMAGRVESLNASISAGILMYEAYRQRRRKE